VRAVSPVPTYAVTAQNVRICGPRRAVFTAPPHPTKMTPDMNQKMAFPPVLSSKTPSEIHQMMNQKTPPHLHDYQKTIVTPHAKMQYSHGNQIMPLPATKILPPATKMPPLTPPPPATKTPLPASKMPHLYSTKTPTLATPLPSAAKMLPLTTPPNATKTPVSFDVKDKDGHRLVSSIIHQAQQEGWEKSLGRRPIISWYEKKVAEWYRTNGILHGYKYASPKQMNRKVQSFVKQIRETYLCSSHSSGPGKEGENIPQIAQLIEEFDEWKKSWSSKSTKAKIVRAENREIQDKMLGAQSPLDGEEPRSQAASDNCHLTVV